MFGLLLVCISSRLNHSPSIKNDAESIFTLKVDTYNFNKKSTIFPIQINSGSKFINVYTAVAKQLGINETDIQITFANKIPHRCKTLKENGLYNGATIKVKKASDNANAAWNWKNGFNFYTVAKPVIYLYPTEEMDVSVSVNPINAEFIAVYPSFSTENTWKVHAYPSGKLTTNGREYTSLFWDAATNKDDFKFDEGFLVKKENAVSFLEEKLREIGLTDLEANEFITFWLPFLNKNGESLVSFQFESYQKQFPLTVSPQPDSVLRVFLAIKKATGNEQVKEQKLTSFERKGFTVVEWGGSYIE